MLPFTSTFQSQYRIMGFTFCSHAESSWKDVTSFIFYNSLTLKYVWEKYSLVLTVLMEVSNMR